MNEKSKEQLLEEQIYQEREYYKHLLLEKSKTLSQATAYIKTVADARDREIANEEEEYGVAVNKRNSAREFLEKLWGGV